MAIVNEKIPEFSGFAVQYDPTNKPFFAAQLVEDLRRIASKDIGKTLLKAIADATPRTRTPTRLTSQELAAVTFFEGVNVVAVPISRVFTQSGFKAAVVNNLQTLVASDAKHHNVKGCPFHAVGGSQALSYDAIAAGDGTGSVSVMKYTNAQVTTSKGETTYSFMVLAHELIHSLHHVTGTRKDSDEEQWTTGIGVYADNPMSENACRRAFGVRLREMY